jgi:hypothetical protein
VEVYSARAVAEAGWRERSKQLHESHCREEREFELLSVVGSVASVLESAGGYCEGTAHPWASSRFTTIDFARSSPQAPVRVAITDVFPEPDVVAALLRDRHVAAAVAASGRTPPKTLAALVTVIADSPIRVGDCEFDFDERALSGFAFHHIAGGRVAVRIALPYRHEVCRGMVAQLGLLLPVPASLAKALARANSRAEGFLMKDQERVSRGLSTSFSTTYGPPSKVPN